MCFTYTTFYLMLMFIARLGFSQIWYSASASLQNINQEIRQCVFENESKLEFFRYWSEHVMFFLQKIKLFYLIVSIPKTTAKWNVKQQLLSKNVNVEPFICPSWMMRSVFVTNAMPPVMKGSNVYKFIF